VSLLAPTERADPRGPLLSWLRARAETLFVPVVSVAEVVAGIRKLRRAGSHRRANAFQAWLDQLILDFDDRILLFDLSAAAATGRLADKARARGHSPGFADLAIAGIAMANGMTLLTRNLRHFAPLGVPARDPYEALPE
jgi:hypothetical protein